MTSGAKAREGAARAISILTTVIVLFIVTGIILFVLEANQSNDIVSVINDVAKFFVGPFENLFTLDEQKVEVAVNWGLGALVYAIVGRILARLVAP
jgi:predicted membrane protein